MFYSQPSSWWCRILRNHPYVHGLEHPCSTWVKRSAMISEITNWKSSCWMLGDRGEDGILKGKVFPFVVVQCWCWNDMTLMAQYPRCSWLLYLYIPKGPSAQIDNTWPKLAIWVFCSVGVFGPKARPQEWNFKFNEWNYECAVSL